jgi:hypothetical protein
VVAAGPAAVGNAFCLVVLCAVGDEEDERQRVVRGAAVADVGDQAVYAVERGVDMRATGAKIWIGVGIEQRSKVGGGVVDGRGIGGRAVDAAG